jgi:hypothetical protein
MVKTQKPEVITVEYEYSLETKSFSPSEIGLFSVFSCFSYFSVPQAPTLITRFWSHDFLTAANQSLSCIEFV